MGSQFRRRDYAPFDLVHFTCRGIGGRRIFHDEHDHAEFQRILRLLIDGLHHAHAPTLLAYAQMPNHQHIFLRLGENPETSPKLMRSLSTRYALAYNKRHGTRGSVFQRPFRGRVVSGGDFIANTFAYIHLNPDASLRTTNSSHAFYIGDRDDTHIDPTLAWKVFGGRAGYMDFFSNTARLRQARAAAKFRLGQ